MKYIYILFGLVLIVSLGKGEEQSPVPFYSRIAVTEGIPRVNEEFVLTYSLIALEDLQETEVVFEIPEGVELVDGEPLQLIFLNLNDSIPVSVRLKILESGPYRIAAHTIIAPEDTIYLLQHYADDFYIVSGEDTASYSETATEGITYNLVSNQVIGEMYWFSGNRTKQGSDLRWKIGYNIPTFWLWLKPIFHTAFS
jgi:hypothetical protein